MVYVPTRHAYLRNDIKNLLMAVGIVAGSGLRSADYNEGFTDALAAVAAGLGIDMDTPGTVTIEQPRRLGGGQ